jgi:hypothetical protein
VPDRLGVRAGHRNAGDRASIPISAGVAVDAAAPSWTATMAYRRGRSKAPVVGAALPMAPAALQAPVRLQLDP